MLVKERVLKDIISRKYTIKIANTEEEVDAALKLRYRVFKEELNRDFNFDEEKDKDKYDDQSHHLVVINNEDNSIIGTYRLQTYEMANNANGFSSEERFHINQFPDDVLQNAVEVGRACISKEHRSGRILFFLWKGFAEYLTHFNKRYLFGYAALDTTSDQIATNTYHHLKSEGFLHPEYLVEPKDSYKIKETVRPDQDSGVDIPQLLQNYLDVGCHICGKPSYNQNGLTHFIILLDVEKISDRTRKLFFG